MKAFIVVVFAGLFLTFYEMSGGSEFEPGDSPFVEEARAEVEPVAEKAAVRTASVSTRDVPEVVTRAPAATTERVVLKLETAAPKPAETVEDKADALTTSIAQAADKAVERALTTDGTEGNLVFTSLGDAQQGFLTQQGTPATETVETPAQPRLDLRFVTASRVNVRGGPGTNFNVIAQVVRNDEVEVLRSDENGWVRLRTPEGQVGWMAERFLVAAN